MSAWSFPVRIPNPITVASGFLSLLNWILHSVSWVKAIADILITLILFSRDLGLNICLFH